MPYTRIVEQVLLDEFKRSKKYERERREDENGEVQWEHVWRGEYETTPLMKIQIAPFDTLISQACRAAGIELETMPLHKFKNIYVDAIRTELGKKLMNEAASYDPTRIVYPVQQNLVQAKDSRLPEVMFVPLNSVGAFFQFIDQYPGPFVAMLADKFRFPFIPWDDFQVEEKTNNIFEVRTRYGRIAPIIDAKKTWGWGNIMSLDKDLSVWKLPYPYYMQKSGEEKPKDFPLAWRVPHQRWNFLILNQSLDSAHKSAYRKDFILFYPSIRKDPLYPTAEEIREFEETHRIGVLPVHEIIWYYQSLGYNYDWKRDERRTPLGVF